MRYDDVSLSKERYDWLRSQYVSPLTGMRDMGVSIASEWGYDAREYPAMLSELEIALSEALIETAHAVMREHGLRGPADAPGQTREDPQ